MGKKISDSLNPNSHWIVQCFHVLYTTGHSLTGEYEKYKLVEPTECINN